jgi:hypothetical protein
MRSSLNGQDTLFAALPIVLVLITLVGAIIFFSQNSLDLRSRANKEAPTPTVVQKIIPTATTTPALATPEYACSGLYQPVCGNNQQTYNNACEAQLAGALVAYQGECKKVITTPTPSPLP